LRGLKIRKDCPNRPYYVLYNVIHKQSEINHLKEERTRISIDRNEKCRGGQLNKTK